MSKCSKELQEIVDYELSTIRDRAEFTICDIRTFAKVDGFNLDDYKGGTLRAALNKRAKLIGKDVTGQGVWVKV